MEARKAGGGGGGAVLALRWERFKNNNENSSPEHTELFSLNFIFSVAMSFIALVSWLNYIF